MATCARIHCGIGGELPLRPVGWGRQTMKSTLAGRVSFSDRRICRCSAAGRSLVSTSETATTAPLISDGGKSGSRGAVVSRETLDDWTRGSVMEIVKNLSESPLLVQVYAGNNGTLRTATEKAGDWNAVKRMWESNEAQIPEGVIFVEKLTDDGVIDGESNGDQGGCEYIGDGDCRAWGIVAQGRGVDCGPICYLLKTNRVGSGSGAFCTHFCLVKVKSFRETTKSQLQNCWLLQNAQ